MAETSEPMVGSEVAKPIILNSLAICGKYFSWSAVVRRQQQRLHAQGVVEERRGHAGAGRGDLLGDEHAFEQTPALAAVLPGDVAVHEPASNALRRTGIGVSSTSS